MHRTPRPTRDLTRRVAIARLSQLARLTLAAALLAPAGCKGFLGRGNADPQPGARITFVNETTEQASVFAVATSGESFRIGNVPAGRTERLTIPRSVLGSGPTVSIVARRLATTRGVSSGPITVRPGDEFTVTLPPSGNTLAVLPR
jgi:hypothetical protein